MAVTITKRKKQLLDFIKQFSKKLGYFPTLEEIAKQFKLKSLATVHQHLSELEALGLIQREAKHARAMQITQPESYLAGSAINLPLAGIITAGAPIEAVEDRTETLTVPRHMINNENTYVLKVKGDSMIESLISDGDYVVVEKKDYAQDGDIVVALLEDGTATLKEFHKEKNYIRLQPRNRLYKPIKVKHVIIQGKVLGIIRKFN
ncbi:MAG: transcriptional repressor LexA [Patescibacteria group bacterium]|jgi:repressor LexA